MTIKTIKIGGMTCVNCQSRLEQKLKSTVGVQDAQVNYTAGTAALTYDASVIAFNEIKAVIETLGYSALDEGKPEAGARELAGTLVIILALYALLRGLGITAAASFPLAEAGMNYGMLFVIGLITSVHCIAMCGGINLSQCLRGEVSPPAPDAGTRLPLPPSAGGSAPRLLAAPILYNGGRVISYTIVGVIAGALGSAITVSGRFQGIVQIIAGVFMVIMGINMLGVFPALRRFTPRMPRLFAKKIDEQKSVNKNPLVIGLLNGLMPCGPLQAMQLYALSTGSPAAGGISMFLFSMGTVPLMFAVGALSTLLSKKFTHTVMKAGAILVTVMGLTMFTYGWGLGGLPNPLDTLAALISPGKNGTGGDVFAPVIENGVQIVNSTLGGGRYPAIAVQQGIPVKWVINAPAGSINGCNNRMIIREYGIEHRFKQGENVIEFMPEKTGKFSFSCWMGMIRSSITVLAEGQSIAGIKEPDHTPRPAGVTIPTDSIAVAEIMGTVQNITINLHDDGITPAIMVMQRGLPAVWTINNESLDPGNSALVFPAFFTRLAMGQGDNVVRLMPVEDFEFSTADHVFYGYVKVLDDIGNVDTETIKTEVSNFETLIYPDAYFDAAGSGRGCSCCGGVLWIFPKNTQRGKTT